MSKADLPETQEAFVEVSKAFARRHIKLRLISAATGAGVKELANELYHLVRGHRAAEDDAEAEPTSPEVLAEDAKERARAERLAAKKSSTRQPAAKKPVATRPARKKRPTAKKRAATTPAAKKLAKSATKKKATATKKGATKRPARLSKRPSLSTRRKVRKPVKSVRAAKNALPGEYGPARRAPC